ncbi:MAG: isocitrate/isopropylmalate dehydrogenase family protein [Thermodesulfobacteriota bacterium]
MKTFSIAVLPGDGIGPEIMECTLEILLVLQDLLGHFKLLFKVYRAGAALYQETGEAIEKETLEALKGAHAILKAPVGLPHVKREDGTEAGLLGGILRGGLDLYANVRPILLMPNVPSALAGVEPGGVDYVIVRENTEGLYLSRGLGLVTPQAATDTLLVTARGCERIARFAFDTALRKQTGAPEDGQKRVTLVDKSNVLRSYAFFRRIFLETAALFPQVEAECMYADAAAAALVNRPGHFQVIVTENFLGDILSDLGGATVGGLGFCPSGNIGDRYACFEPIHGSAPDIAGRALANPSAQILAAAMMLEYLGEETAGATLRACLKRALAEGLIQPDARGRVAGGVARVARVLEKLLLAGALEECLPRCK